MRFGWLADEAVELGEKFDELPHLLVAEFGEHWRVVGGHGLAGGVGQLQSAGGNFGDVFAALSRIDARGVQAFFMLQLDLAADTGLGLA